MPTQGGLLTARPGAVPQFGRRQCSLCASDMVLKTFQLQSCRKRGSRRSLAPIRSSVLSSSPAAGATEGTTPAAVSPTRLHRKPQVLAPAGGWPQLRAAVENGADAVYLGLSDFNARARAVNFTPEELPEVRAVSHLTPSPHASHGIKSERRMNKILAQAMPHTTQWKKIRTR